MFKDCFNARISPKTISFADGLIDFVEMMLRHPQMRAFVNVAIISAQFARIGPKRLNDVMRVMSVKSD